jgi:hypothetical protein
MRVFILQRRPGRNWTSLAAEVASQPPPPCALKGRREEKFRGDLLSEIPRAQLKLHSFVQGASALEAAIHFGHFLVLFRIPIIQAIPTEELTNIMHGQREISSI